MTKIELIEKLKGVPDNTKIFVWADHGQQDFVANDISFTTSDIIDDIEYSSEDINWDENDPNKLITGAVIS